MTIQATSREALGTLRGADQLGPDEQAVLTILRQHPEGLTDRECASELGGPSFGWYPSRVSARRNGIIQQNLIYRRDWTIATWLHRKCRLSERTAIAWAIVEGSGEQLQLIFR